MILQFQALSSRRFYRESHRFNVHQHTAAFTPGLHSAPPRARGSHSSTFRLNVSRCCEIRGEHEFPPVF